MTKKTIKVRNPKSDGENIEVEEFYNEDADLMGLRFVDVDGQRKYIVKAHGQYGMWVIHSENGGGVDDSLKGMFTSMADAERAIERYLNHKA